ncbi:hypothetical protein HUT18_16240 [Streptomyces sp. NA04227]|uniref:hypothetical protein n=1 Tax=Streptomyces sp. NA04227 TaxID=2742136 RepID=UPI0015922F28|nr:hypothetical protein [Streptomyces sp. NA04227]QKW07701.1 hypothetical protein HUT18_16240 [Streptomyces sp. NA04227]
MSPLAVSSVRPRTFGPIAGAALLALLLSACGSSDGDGDSDDVGAGGDAKGKTGASSAPAEPSARPSASASSAVPSPSPTRTSPAPAPAVKASDGSRYGACADGTCEVAIDGPTSFAVGGGSFAVQKLKKKQSVDFDLTLASGSGGNGTLKGTCGPIFTFFDGGGGGMLGCTDADAAPKRPDPEPGVFKLQLAGWDTQGAAVIRLVSG